MTFLPLLLVVALSGEASWSSQDVGLLRLEAPARQERSLVALGQEAATIVPRVEGELGVRLARRFRMVLIPADPGNDSALAALDAAAPPWAAGFMIPSLRLGAIRVAQAANYPYGTLESVLAHETAHLLLDDAGAGRYPLWFQEGVATWIGRKWSFEDAMVYSSGLLTTSLPHLSEIDPLFKASPGEARLAYAASFSFVSWSARRYGATWTRDMVREARSGTIEGAWRRISRESLSDAERLWRRSSLIRYRWIPAFLAASPLWLGITLLGLVAGVRRRATARRAREEWARAEEAARSQEDELVDPESD